MGKSRKRICVDCGMMFILQSDEPKRKSRCRECWLKNRVKAWQKEMREMGCNVDDPAQLGVIPEMVDVKKEDLAIVEIEGEKYRDVTSIVFLDGKHKKKYLTQEEEIEREQAKNRRTRYQIRKSDAKRREESEKKNKEKAKVDRNMSTPTNEEMIKVSQLLESGHTVRDIMQKLNISQSYYYKIIKLAKKRGIVHKRKTAPTEEDVREISKMIEEGFTISAIMGRMGISQYFYNTATEKAKKLGITYRKTSSQYTKEEDNIIIQGLKEGLPRAEIGEKLGRKEKAINGRVKRLRDEGVI